MNTWRTLLAIAATDATFEQAELRGRQVWAGKCLHCNAALALELSGKPIGRVTIEHIVPRSAGGSDALENLALACARCNHQKGVRHDAEYDRSPRAREIAERLLEKRRQRWRDPDEG